MKMLALLTLLATLISCGKDSGGSSGNPREKLLGALSAVKRGQTSTTISEGTTVLIDADGSTTNESSNEEEFSVVLKIEGTDVYKYEIEKDLVEGTKEIEVTLISYGPEQLDQMLQTPGISLNGNNLSINFSDEVEYDYMDAIIQQIFNLSFSINLSMPLCEYFSQTTSSGTIKANGTITNFGPNITTTRETCGPIYNEIQLKEIDLSSVTFCDQTQMDDENYECETNKDMSWLTADL